MMAATAADAIKKDPHTFHDDGEDPTAAPDASRNTGFDVKNMHKYWHYIDNPFSPHGTPLVPPPSINAQERIGLFRHTIASASAPDTLAECRRKAPFACFRFLVASGHGNSVNRLE